MKKIIFCGILLSTACFGIFESVFAIGMITEPIVIKDILRGGEISKTVTMFNPESKTAIFTIGTNGDIDGWVEFFEKENLNSAVTKINVPAVTYYDVIAVIKVPAGTPNGEYNGEIFVKQSPTDQPKEGESSVSVSQMVSREVKITVTDKEVVKLDTSVIPEKYDIASGDPLRIKFVYENQGNIVLQPSYQLKITKDEKTIFNAIFPYPDDEEAVKPGETKTMPDIEWQTIGQEDGRYTVEISTMINSKILETNNFYFNIGATQVLGIDDNKEGVMSSISKIGGGNTTIGWFILGGILLVIATILKFIFLRKKNIIEE